MIFRTPSIFFAVFATCCPLSSVRAAWSGDFDMEPGSGAAIKIETAYDSFPAAGYVPCRVSIKNGTTAARVWTLDFMTFSGEDGRPSTMRLNREFAVPAGQSANFDVLIPVCPTHRNDGYAQVPRVSTQGYGVRSGGLSLPYSNSRGARNQTAFVAMSPALALRSWKVLRTNIEKSKKLTLAGSEIDLSLLSEDWRGLLGVGAFFISTNEYSALSPARRLATRTWVAQGGTLIFCGEGEVRDFGEAGVRDGAFGLGNVRRIAWDGSSELPLEQAADLIGDIGDLPGDRLKDAAPVWRFAESLGTPPRNVTFLAVFITLFAVAVGPLNLFWFASPAKRHRLFWTTPLISVSASLLLGAVILVQDGFGGRGTRMTLRYLLPGDKRVLVMQEQASRTGLLLSRTFTTGPGLFLSPLNAPASIGARRTTRDYLQDSTGYGGDWFQSRAVQGQFIEAVEPSREAVEIVGANAGRPVVRSSIPATLEKFYYVDANGNCWKAQNIRTGESVELTATDARNPVLDMFKPAGPMLRHATRHITSERGFFYAITATPLCVETLPVIKWEDERTICIGPVIQAP